MADKYALIEHSNVLNRIICDTFHSTQRIKFTAFDVSPQYVIFGVNSGGIYIFTREPCQFLKLIPSTHGPANLLSVSPNQENLAIAVSTGLVIVLEKCFSDNFQQQVFGEHEGNTVTAMKWNGNDLYCGDSNGRVSVVTLRNFLTMFQTPVACLMHLDSQIVQLDVCSKFLLVSTQTRSILCDTETERYRQIGKKMRDGIYGACFMNSGNPLETSDTYSRTRGSFQTVGDNEQLSPSMGDGEVKIYCARPGVRLWEADFQANVVVTHQFRSSLSRKQSDIVLWDDGDRLKIKKNEGGSIGENFNFGQIFSYLNRFVLTFRGAGFYIFEPSSSALQYWSAHLRNIKDMKIVDSFLYIWHSDLEISVLSLLSVEELVLKSLMRKKFRLCGDLCVHFYGEIEKLVPTSKKLYLLSILESKLENSEILDKLAPLFQKLKNFAKTPTLEKFKNGIVTVNALPVLPESVENFESAKEEKVKGSHEILLEQYKINKIHKTIETTDFAHLMQSQDPNYLYQLVKKFQEAISEESCDLWCKEIYLKHLKLSHDLNSDALNYASDAFLQINSNENLSCKCSFPLPQAHELVPEYYEIACKLMENYENYDIFLKRVPQMYRNVLEKIDPKEIHLKISLIIQFSDRQIIEMHLKKIPYDVWDESVNLLLKLKSGQCLNCENKIDPLGAFDWTIFATLMVQSIKPFNSIKLLKRYANLLPKGQLDQFFYQYCIFCAVSNVNNGILNKTFHDESVKRQFESLVGGFLRKKYLCGSDFYDPPSHKSTELVSNCDHCQLPLKIPIIDPCTKLKCGHKYHKTCFLYNKSQCPTCDPIL